MKTRFAILAAAFVLAFSACGGRYGGLQLNGGAEQAFISGAMKPNLVYYTYGSSASPDVVIGVDKSFALENRDSWYPLVPQTSENLRSLTKMMYDRYRMDRPEVTLRGFRMYDQHGRYVGDWYSAFGTTTSIKSDESNRVVIYPPQLPVPGPGLEGRGIMRVR